MQNKPDKPRPDFPLYAHRNGQWAKRINKDVHYFGTWDDPEGALKKYLDCRDDLQAGRPRKRAANYLAIADICNHFLASKEALVESKELSRKTFSNYRTTVNGIVAAWGRDRNVFTLSPMSFSALRSEFAKTRGQVGLANAVRMTRILFRWAFEAEFIENPVRFGPDFKIPSKAAIRRERQSKPEKVLDAKTIRCLLRMADSQVAAMVLLGINCGLGNFDCSEILWSHVDLESGWVNFPRPKTSVDRRCPLWPETMGVLLQQPRDRGGRIFLKSNGIPWVSHNRDSLAIAFREMLTRLGKHRRGIGFYALRHTFETVAGSSRDQVAVDMVMGHADHSMAAEYRGEIGDDRLRDVVAVVRKWLFPKT